MRNTSSYLNKDYLMHDDLIKVFVVQFAIFILFMLIFII